MTNNPIKALITESGKEAMPENEHEIGSDRHHGFAAAHPKRELVTPREDLANTVVEVEPVWQVNIIDDRWEYIKNSEVDYYEQHGYNTRQAYQLEVVKEEKPKEQGFNPAKQMGIIAMAQSMFTKPATPIVQGSEEGELKQKFLNKFDCYADVDNGLPIPAMTFDAVLEFVNWQKQQRNDEVVAIIEERALALTKG